MNMNQVARLPWPPGWGPDDFERDEKNRIVALHYHGPAGDRTGLDGTNRHVMRGDVRTVHDIDLTLRAALNQRGVGYPYHEQLALVL